MKGMQSASSPIALREGASHRQVRILLFGGFGGLLLLLGGLGLSAISFLYQIERREERIRSDYVNRDRALEVLRANIYSSGTYLRDFLLAETGGAAATQRRQFLERRALIEAELAGYQKLAGPDQQDALRRLNDELAGFFLIAAPVLEWNAADRRTLGYRFMQDEVLPRRSASLALADRIQQASDKQLNAGSAAVTELMASFRTKLLLLLVFTLLIGLLLAGAALWRLLRLEQESLGRFTEVLHAREELKRLSSELVAAQENERRRISRELHDEVGQVLSAIVLGLANLRSALRDNNREEALQHLQRVQDMTERNVSVVRNISLLLRPTMLDDLGLIPAVKWLARETSRSASLAVDVMAEAFTDELPEEHRTCIFRVVQEAVRNAARHSGARQVRIYLQETRQPDGGEISVSVQDDGKGFAASQEPGLGMIGMQERVVRLGGQLQVDSEPGRGTIVSFVLPIPQRTKKSVS